MWKWKKKLNSDSNPEPISLSSTAGQRYSDLQTASSPIYVHLRITLLAVGCHIPTIWCRQKSYKSAWTCPRADHERALHRGPWHEKIPSFTQVYVNAITTTHGFPMDSNPMIYGEDCWSEDKMKINGSSRLMNSSSLSSYEISLNRPPWVSTTLGCFLIFTIVVDILGNLLVIFSVCRNKKLRNAGKIAFKTNSP